MSPLEFWSMPPVIFDAKVQGYFNQQNRARIYFRESWALLYNVNRRENAAAITGEEVMPLIGEKAKQNRQKRVVWTPKEIARIQALYNTPANNPQPEPETQQPNTNTTWQEP